MTKHPIKTSHDPLEDVLSRRILIIDGSMGALLYSYELGEDDFRGKQFARHSHDLKNCTEALVVSKPELIEHVHRAYLEAGADLIETDTFNANPLSLEEFGLEEYVVEINTKAVEIARRAADDHTRKNRGKPRFVAGSIGPTKKQLSIANKQAFSTRVSNDVSGSRMSAPASMRARIWTL